MASDEPIEQVPVRPKVAFLGPFASYSHQVCKNFDSWQL